MMHTALQNKHSRFPFVNLLTTEAWYKTSSQSNPQAWVTELRMLENTKGETLWSALEQLLPHSPFNMDNLPDANPCSWVLVIFVIDFASSNRRVVAFAETSCDMSHVLFVTVPCFMHGLQRCVVPVLRYGNTINEVFLISHLLAVCPH